MLYQIFTRKTSLLTAGRPRRVKVVETPQEAIEYCTQQNEARTAKQKRERFFYEWANLPWYLEAFGR